MAYAIQDDLLEEISEEELVQLTDDEGTGVIDPTKVTRAIDNADAEIDGYLAVRHSVPLSSTPTLIRGLSVAIAIYILYTRRDHADVPESRKDRYRNAVKTLQSVSKGAVKLGIATTPATDADDVQYDSPDRTFNNDNLKNF
jgi:phage gp36-like protein